MNLGRLEDETLQGARPDWWWTGKPPIHGRCPGVDAEGVITSLPLLDYSRCTREEALAYFDNTWTLTEVLFSALASEEAFYRPPYHNLRHPLIFYYCHPAVLFINKLRLAGLIGSALNADYEHLFETGVDEMSWDDLSKNERRWPSIQEVNAYRRTVYGIVREVLETHPDLDGPLSQASPLWALLMGFEHERIHLETSSVLIRELPLSLVQRPAQWPSDHPTAFGPQIPEPQAGRDYPENPWHDVGGADVVLGKPRQWPTFGWDNEYGERRVTVAAFSASRYLVSNGEFWAFVKAGGYRERRYWSEEGWQWKTFRNAKWPTFWVPDGPSGLHRFKLRTCFETREMPWSWPAEVNYFEAKAYCAWRSEVEGGTALRLPSEAEHQLMRPSAMRGLDRATRRDPVMAHAGSAMARSEGLNLNLAYGSASPVDAFAPTAEGLHDAMGNVWQWCEDHFNPLQGSKLDPLYEDFSVPCYDGKHQMLLGGSFVSTGDEASIWARFHFRPHFYQFAGFRPVRAAGDGGAVKLGAEGGQEDVYETRQLLNEYLLMHYGAPEDVMPYAFGPRDAVDFAQRCARMLNDAAREEGINGGQALDVGCAVGGAVFELARHFDAVTGVDLSKSFIDAADTLRRDGRLDYDRKDEGKLMTPRTAVIDPAIARERTTFRQADACALPAEYEGFDAVLMANLLCRLPSPRACLSRLGGPRGLVRSGGLLLIVSPYTWLEQFTSPEAWLGGFERNGERVRAADTLRAMLEDEFELIKEEDVPLVIREHARKFQYIVSHAMLWRRK
ncbi:5-histidylcysteine sulfoxide synthase [bacterium]|nr:5-histidylcysteine sulfoxide synthase [bacterium]